MTQNNKQLLDGLAEQFRSRIPSMQWGKIGPTTVSGQCECYHVWLALKGEWAYLLCGGLPARGVELLSEINSLLAAPLRIAKRRTNGGPHIRASWPVRFCPLEYAEFVIENMCRLISGPLVSFVCKPVDTFAVRRLKDVMTTTDVFQVVPTNGESFEFLIGKGKDALQIRTEQLHRQILSLVTLVTNYTTDEKLVQKVVTAIILLFNSRLKWARLVQRGHVIECDVTVPTSALCNSCWQLIKQELYQARSFQNILKVIQEPAVAAEAAQALCLN
jgi:hypothetical protein